MSASFIYPDVIEKIRSVCRRHLSEQATIDEFQSVIQMGETSIAAIEENDIRDYLIGIEGEIENVKFTVDNDQQTDESKKIASAVLKWLSDREGYAPST